MHLAIGKNRDRPAEEVYVTGSFDNWGKSTKLTKEGDAFTATVSLPSEKIFYKYVVDGNWTVDTTARREPDSSGIENNVLLPIDLADEPTDMSQATISSAAPDSSTAALAAQVPTESETNGNVDNVTASSVAPDSTTAALAAEVPKEAKTPSLKNVPGGFPQTPSIESSDPTPVISTGEEEPSNHVTPAPGDSVPYDHLVEDTNGGVKLDKESPEIADASYLGVGEVPVLPDVVTPTEHREVEGRGVPDIAALSSADVPEIVKENQEQAHTLEDGEEEEAPVVAPATETASGQKDEEDGAVATAIPEVVRQSQIEAHASPEASAVESSVEAKGEVGSELKQEISPVAAVGEPAVGQFVKPAEQIPEVVLNSMAEARAEPEAAGVTETVEAKRVVEDELTGEAKPPVPIEPNTTAEDTTATPAPKPSDNHTENGLTVPQTSSPPLSPTSLSPTCTADPTKNGMLKNGTPRKSIDNGESPNTLTKKKRFSIFGNLRDKLRFGKDKGKSKGEMSP